MNNVTSYAAACYDITENSLTELTGGYFNMVFEFKKSGRDYILRITPPNDEMSLQSFQSIMHWLKYAAGKGAAVAVPVKSVNAKYVESYNEHGRTRLITVFEKAPGILAQQLAREHWQPLLIRQIGRVIGGMHNLAKEYSPPASILKRPCWQDVGNCFNGRAETVPEIDTIKQLYLSFKQTLCNSSRTADSWGLIHTDLHFANINIEPASRQITIFDFDDCSCGWYMMDLALPMLDIFIVLDEIDNPGFTGLFTSNLLDGYLKENPAATPCLKQIPLLLKLLEASLFLKLYKYYKPEDRRSWEGKFMAGRQQRIEGGVPVVDYDFCS